MSSEPALCALCSRPPLPPRLPRAPAMGLSRAVLTLSASMEDRVRAAPSLLVACDPIWDACDADAESLCTSCPRSILCTLAPEHRWTAAQSRVTAPFSIGFLKHAICQQDRRLGGGTSLLSRVDAALFAAITASAWSDDTTLAVVRVLPLLLVPASRAFRKPSASTESRCRLIATVQICIAQPRCPV